MGKKNYSVKGFRFAGVGEVALIVSDVPASAAAVFTKNKVKAAPVLIDRMRIRRGRCQAIVANSGNANACTGNRGVRDAMSMARYTSEVCKVPEGLVLVASTGVIGKPLEMKKIKKGILNASRRLRPNGVASAVRAIMTTDAYPKIVVRKGRIGKKKYSILGIAKGAGMIMPNMATMLAFVMTDLNVDRKILNKVFKKCVDETFNRITVDGDTSTNDMALIMANGAAGNHRFSINSPIGRRFSRQLFEVLSELAMMIVGDGEGATKVAEINVVGAKNNRDAKKIAYAVGNSLLVKTAIFGTDANWGRILAAAGRAGATLDPERADIYYEGVCVYRKGQGLGRKAEGKAEKVMKKKNFKIKIDCHLGKGEWRIFASDLSFEYVKINANYRT